MLLNDELAEQMDVFGIAGVAPKTAVFMHVNDLFGTGNVERHPRTDGEI